MKIAVSGGFDPLTPGHVEYFKLAKELGDYLIVIVNSDDFLMKKKGYCFMPFDDRKAIVESIRYVDEVVDCIDTDESVAETIRMIRPDVFAKGGDRNLLNLPEKEVQACVDVGCRIICNVGSKTHSSSWYLARLKS